MLVGNSGCGEDEMLSSYLSMVPRGATGDGVEGKFVSAEVPVGKYVVNLSLHHYTGSSKMSRARHLGYMSADMVVFLFSLNDSMSFVDLEEEFTVDATYLQAIYKYYIYIIV